jgi:hypothetical protein
VQEVRDDPKKAEAARKYNQLIFAAEFREELLLVFLEDIRTSP